MNVLTAKIQLYVPDEKDQSNLMQTMTAYQNACNWLSKQVFQSKVLKHFHLDELYYRELRERFCLKAQMAQSVTKTVVARYKTCKSNGHDWTQIEFKQPQYDLVWNRDYSLKESCFSVNTLTGRLKLRFEKKGMRHFFDGTWKFGTAKLVYKFNKWFLHISMSKKDELPDLTATTQVVGIDLGINFLATTYDGDGKTIFFNGREIKHHRGKAKALRKQLQQRKTPSSRKKIKTIGSRENRYVTDMNHQVTKALVENYPKGTLFVLEDLSSVRQATEKVRVKHHYVTVSWAFYRFRKFLEYKAALNGQRVVVVSPKYTSQTCPKCEHVEKANRDKKHHHFCCKKCQYQSNDDRIGAMNLFRKGLDMIETDVQGA
ncbi:RNA-guided endonuclease TnpB family protein [Enterococcus sp. AZ109]|uniref:RNA-guided endonuclease TnpB family protein n=1 Tax=Enterococcus sp. AZ109 TaxID=2774634 RepID=UPI003F235CF7